MPSQYTPHKRSLGELLSMTSPPIVVPEWQRNYSWTRSEVETFWSDLIAFGQSYPDATIAGQEYFLGSVVIVETPTSHLLLDGQQRIATAAILLSVIRDALRRSNRDAAARVQTRYLSDFDDARDEESYKITLNAYDRDFFKREVLDQRDAAYAAPQPSIESHSLIRGAREFFSAMFDQESRSVGAEVFHRWALRVLTVLTGHMSVVAVSSEDEDNAAAVFETLNDRGIGLSTPDLLRTLILRRARAEDRNEIIDLWGEVLELESEASLKTFLRHYWISRYGDVKTQSLYREIKARILADDISSLQFSRSLRDAALLYSNILLGKDDDQETADCLADISALGASVLYPAVMAAYEVGNTDELRTFLRVLTNVYVRHSVIGRMENSRLEDAIYKVARDLRATRDFMAASTALATFAPGDADFANAFRTVSVTRRESARYVLREIERKRRATDELAVAPPSKVHVEHIYPQTPPATDRWPNHSNVINRLGNQTLLGRKLNTAAKNAPFLEKKAYYQQSDIMLTRALLDRDHWDLAEIDRRQDELAREAAEIWPIPPTRPPETGADH